MYIFEINNFSNITNTFLDSVGKLSLAEFSEKKNRNKKKQTDTKKK